MTLTRMARATSVLYALMLYSGAWSASAAETRPSADKLPQTQREVERARVELTQAQAIAEQFQLFLRAPKNSPAYDANLNLIRTATSRAKIPRTAARLPMRTLAGNGIATDQFRGKLVVLLFAHPGDPLLEGYLDVLQKFAAPLDGGAEVQLLLVVLESPERLNAVPKPLVVATADVTQSLAFLQQTVVYSGTFVLIDHQATVQYQGTWEFRPTAIALLRTHEVEVASPGRQTQIAEAQGELGQVNREIAELLGGDPLANCEKAYAATASPDDAAETRRFCKCLASSLVPVLTLRESRAFVADPVGFVRRAYGNSGVVTVSGPAYTAIGNCQ
jgi:hypothetical protein